MTNIDCLSGNLVLHLFEEHTVVIHIYGESNFDGSNFDVHPKGQHNR